MNASMPGSTAPTAPPAPPTAPKPRGGFGRAVLTLLVLLLAGLVAWTWFSLSWSYSEGDRAGVLQKFSRKGWICKTWEGEVAQYVVAGVAPRIWTFSVRDGGVAADVGRQVGRNVQLHYTEHIGVPTSCFGDTPYFVERVTVMTDPPLMPGMAAPAAAAPQPPDPQPAAAPSPAVTIPPNLP